jgi:signal transduction histidine kinase
MHQGSVWVESDEATGAGTLFCFTLPLANDHLSCDEFATASALLE